MNNEIKTWQDRVTSTTLLTDYPDLMRAEIAELRARIESLAADSERWQSILKLIIQELPKKSASSLGNAPGHGHANPGVWDSDNGILAGKECAWCKTWNSAIDAIAKEKA